LGGALVYINKLDCLGGYIVTLAFYWCLVFGKRFSCFFGWISLGWDIMVRSGQVRLGRGKGFSVSLLFSSVRCLDLVVKAFTESLRTLMHLKRWVRNLDFRHLAFWHLVSEQDMGLGLSFSGMAWQGMD
jgi:hypothetical protein